MVDVQVTLITMPCNNALLGFKWHSLQSVERGQTSVRSADTISKGLKATHWKTTYTQGNYTWDITTWESLFPQSLLLLLF